MAIKNWTSAASPCARLRAAYHDCFNRWYSEKFSKGQWDKEECVSEWDKYRACLADLEHIERKDMSSSLVCLAYLRALPSYPIYASRPLNNKDPSMKQHLEDKHLRQLLSEAEAAIYLSKDDSDHSVDADGVCQ